MASHYLYDRRVRDSSLVRNDVITAVVFITAVVTTVIPILEKSPNDSDFTFSDAVVSIKFL